MEADSKQEIDEKNNDNNTMQKNKLNNRSEEMCKRGMSMYCTLVLWRKSHQTVQ